MDPQRTDLADLEYPGRLIVIGAAPAGPPAVVYAITGRSPSSQARRLVRRDGGVWVEPTDEATLKTGNADLLIYPALLFSKDGVAVSNGKQTSDVRDRLRPGLDPVSVLSAALAAWDFEPDAPIFTPRISGCVTAAGAALSVVRRGPSGETLRGFFEVRPRPGEGRLVSTYEGPSADPLPVFRGEPRFVGLAGGSAAEIAAAFYAALGPAPGGRDLRVAVACALADPAAPEGFGVRIINRNERT